MFEPFSPQKCVLVQKRHIIVSLSFEVYNEERVQRKVLLLLLLMAEQGPKVGDARSLWNFTPSPGAFLCCVGVLRVLMIGFLKPILKSQSTSSLSLSMILRTYHLVASAFASFSFSSLLPPCVSSRCRYIYIYRRSLTPPDDSVMNNAPYETHDFDNNNNNKTGWTKAEVENLVIVLKKFGVGRWVQIVDSGALPGKQIQQLNGQTQRLLGKQSLAEYTGLQLDVLAVKQANDALTGEDVVRKNGLITNQGGKMEKEQLKAKREENVRLYGLTPEQIEAIEIPKPVRDAGLGAAAYMGKNHNKGGVNGGLGPTKRVVNVDEVKVEELNEEEKVEVLKQLRKRLLAVRMANTSDTNVNSETAAAMTTTTTTTKKNTVKEDNANATVKDVTNVVANEAKKTAAGKRAAGAKKPDAKMTKKSKKSKKNDDDGDDGDDSPSAEGPVEMLVNMGFTKKMAKDAIRETGGDISAATEWLFANT